MNAPSALASLPSALRQSLFITGTDTGIGKTWVATRLLRALGAGGLRAAGMKPVAAGADPGPQGLCNEDALALMAASTVPLRYEQVNPCCLRSPTSPHLAAQREGSDIDLSRIKSAFVSMQSISDVIIAEGAGGWLAPIADPARAGEAGPTMQDIAVVLGLPVLLVVGVKLGCISHAMLTAAAIGRSGLPLAGWIANPIDADFPDYAPYVESLAMRLPAPRLSF